MSPDHSIIQPIYSLPSPFLVQAEARAEFAERSVQKLQKEVDRLEDDLLGAKEKNKKLEEEMEAAFQDIQNM
jgi:peptidoglycan hydrolase CwlO-like protein